MFSIEINKRLNAVEKDWLSLCENNPEITPFQEYDYFKRTIRYFFYYLIAKRCIIKYYTVKCNNEPILIAPIIHYKNGINELFGNVNGYNYCNMVYRKSPLFTLAFDYLMNYIKQLHIHKTANTLLVKHLANGGGKNVLIYNYQINHNVKVIFGTDYNKYYKTLSSSTRQNIRTAYNRISKKDLNLSLEVLYGGEFSQKRFDDIMELYISRHIKRYNLKYNFVKRWLLKHFHFATQNYIKCKSAVTFALFIDNKLAAFMSGLKSQAGEYIVPRLSINDEFKFYSPGMILINETIKHLIANENIHTLDLSQGEEEYKYRMGGIKHYTHNFLNIHWQNEM